MAEIIFWPAVMSPSPLPPLPWAWLAVTPAAMLPVSSSTQNLFGFCPVLIALRTDAMSSAAPRIGPSISRLPEKIGSLSPALGSGQLGGNPIDSVAARKMEKSGRWQYFGGGDY